MGVVRYSREGDGYQPGYLIDDYIIDLSDRPVIAEVQDVEVLSMIDRASTNGQEVGVYPRDTVTLASPVNPQSVVRLDGCYEHDVTDDEFNPPLEEAGLNEQDRPSLWVAPPSVVAGPEDEFILPPQVDDVRVGVELGLVLGETITKKNTHPTDAIVGATICTSIRTHDQIPGLEGYKMYDGCLPCGPAITPIDDIDLSSLLLGLRVNGEPIDVRTTGDWRFPVTESLSYVSDCLSLSAGDIITMGDPIRGSPAIDAGDEVSAWIEDLGTLTTTFERNKES